MSTSDWAGRPIPDAAKSVSELCQQIGEAITLLTSGAVIGVKPVPQIFPQWEVTIRLLPFPKGD